jgi:hypothetical protein
MKAPVAVIPAPAPAQQASNMRQWLAERRVIAMKENRTIANVPSIYGPFTGPLSKVVAKFS